MEPIEPFSEMLETMALAPPLALDLLGPEGPVTAGTTFELFFFAPVLLSGTSVKN